MGPEEFLWVEKYRPKSVDDCILPDRIKDVFRTYVARKEVPHLLLSGTAGVGKTTIAKAMCREIGLDHMTINASDERGIGVLRDKVKGYAQTLSFRGTRKVVILDEADGITPDAQAALRGVMEEFSANCTFILTCNYKAKIIDAIQSRCAAVDFLLSQEEKVKMMLAFLKRLVVILTTEGVAQADKKVLAKIIEKYFPDYRRIINETQRLASLNGKIDDSVVEAIADVRNADDLFKALKTKNFSDARKWVVQNLDVDSARFYRKIYDAMIEHFKPDSIPMLVILIARYMYNEAFVADKEVNQVAFLSEVMADCEFK